MSGVFLFFLIFNILSSKGCRENPYSNITIQDIRKNLKEAKKREKFLKNKLSSMEPAASSQETASWFLEVVALRDYCSQQKTKLRVLEADSRERSSSSLFDSLVLPMFPH